MDFSKIVVDAQTRKDFSASRLPLNEWYAVWELKLVPSAYGGDCVRASLDTGDRVFLPPKLSRALAPYVNDLKAEDDWAIRYTGNKEEFYMKDSKLVPYIAPQFQMEKRKVIRMDEPIDLDGAETASSDEAVANEIDANDAGTSRPSGTVGGGAGGMKAPIDANVAGTSRASGAVAGGSGGMKPPKQVGGGKRKRGIKNCEDDKKAGELIAKLRKKEALYESQVNFITDSEGDEFFAGDFSQLN